MITMLLGGLWHGGAWTFVIWGALHGVALVVHREWLRLTEHRPRGAIHHALARLAADHLLGMRRVDLFPRNRFAARVSGVAKFRAFPEPGHGGSGRLDALGRSRSGDRPLGELSGLACGMVAAGFHSGICRGVRLRSCRRARISSAALHAVHLFSVLKRAFDREKSRQDLQDRQNLRVNFANLVNSVRNSCGENHRGEWEDEYDSE